MQDVAIGHRECKDYFQNVLSMLLVHAQAQNNRICALEWMSSTTSLGPTPSYRIGFWKKMHAVSSTHAHNTSSVGLYVG